MLHDGLGRTLSCASSVETSDSDEELYEIYPTTAGGVESSATAGAKASCAIGKQAVACRSRDVSPEVTATSVREWAAEKRSWAHRIPCCGDEGNEYRLQGTVTESGDSCWGRVCKRPRLLWERHDTDSEEGGEGGDWRDGSDSEYEDEENQEETYEVEAVVDHKKEKSGSVNYLLKWKGYSNKWNTWEAADNLSCRELIRRYWEKLKQAKAPAGCAARRVSVSGKAFHLRSPVTDDDRRKFAVLGENGGGRDSDHGGKDFVMVNEQHASTVDPVSLESNGIRTGFRLPPYHQWEERAFRVVSVEKSDEGLVGEVEWYPGVCTTHPASLIREHCPRKLVDFYELRLRFITDND